MKKFFVNVFYIIIFIPLLLLCLILKGAELVLGESEKERNMEDYGHE